MPLLGCSVVPGGQHIGLQQLAALASSANTFLGPSKRYKFVENQQSGESNFVGSPFRLLEELDLSCAAGQLLNETVQAHQKAFGTGTACLVFMVGVWSTAALECLREGIPIQCIVSAMQEGLDSCLDVCKGIRLQINEAVLHFGPNGDKHSTEIGTLMPLKSVGAPSLSSQYTFWLEACGIGQRKVQKAEISEKQANPSGKAKIKLTHSRYFGKGERTEMGSSATLLSAFSGEAEPLDVTRLAGSLRHHCEDGMSLVLQAHRMQSSCGMFDVSKLVTCTLPGLPEGCACVLQGFLTLISEEQAPIAKRLERRNLHIAIITGDLTESYRHPGFCKLANVRRVTGNLDVLGILSEGEWGRKALMTLQRLKVDVLLVGGTVGRELQQSLVERGILVFQSVTRGILQDFAKTTAAVPVTYLSQLSEDCVGHGVRASMWRECEKAVAVNLQASGTWLVTAVITSSVSSKLQLLEDQFWGCAHRLYHAIKDGHVLPGAGFTEMICAHHLRELSTPGSNQTKLVRGDSNPYRGLVLQRMVEGWLNYCATVNCNGATGPSKLEAWTVINQTLKDLEMGTLPRAHLLGLAHGDEGGTEVVYDNVEVKLEAWRKALDLVVLVLQTDTEIIIGLSPSDIEQESHLMLL